MLLLFALSILSLTLSLHADVNICDDVKILELDEFNLTASEKLLLCGDKRSNAYQYIPLYQKELYLKAYLQARSYLNPKFEIQDNTLLVHLGDTYEVSKVNITSDNNLKTSSLKKDLKRVYRKELLTPQTLNKIENHVKEEFRQVGYACIRPKGNVIIDKNLILIDLKNEKKYRFGVINRERIKGLLPEALDRFYPFERHHVFNSRLLELTEKRFIRSEVVQGTYFTDNCLENPEELAISQFFIIGPPRTIRFGAGASTELGPMFRFKWNNNRFKEMASKLGASLNLSYRVQSLSLRSEQFFWREAPRRSLYSDFTLYREDQKSYEETSLTFDNLFRFTRDKRGKFYSWALGPSYEYGLFSTADNVNTRTYSSIFLKSYFRFMDHDYEFYDIHPEEGNAFNMDLDLRSKNLGFHSDVVRINSDYTHFDRLFYWGKGSVIAGVKALAGTSIVNRDVSLSSLPPVVKFYAGGSDDIRGFDLRSLPFNDGQGALTRLGAKFELRRTHFIKPTLELFTFYDLVFMGEHSWQLDKTYWDSIGVGLRWLSPIGLVQTFLANSYEHVPYENLGPYAFIGLGGSF